MTNRQYAEMMEEYVDMTVVKRRLEEGGYMNMFAFMEDIERVWERARRYGDTRVKRVAENMRERYRRMRRELEEIPIKRY